MKRKQITTDNLINAVVQLKNKFVGASPEIQQKILIQISGLIENLEGEDIKNAFIQVRNYFETLAKQHAAPSDLEQFEQTKTDYADFFETVEKDRCETVSALEEISNKEAAE